MAEGKAYEKAISYIENQVLDGTLRLGDRLPPERELSGMLDISRSSVRTGLTVLEAIGVVSNQHGSGNYVSGSFDSTLVSIMTMMYALDELDYNETREFRYAAELQAVSLACSKISDAQREVLRENLSILETSTDEEEQTRSDQKIHQTIVEASGNRVVIANYLALGRMLERVIRKTRQHVSRQSSEIYQKFQHTHRRLVESVCSGDADAAKAALQEHFTFVLQDIDT